MLVVSIKMHNKDAGNKTVRLFAADAKQAKQLIHKSYSMRGWIIDSARVFHTSHYFA